MNIFYLDKSPKKCAEYHNDKHVIKMILELAQLLSTAHRVLDGTEYTDLTSNGRRIKRWRLDDKREPALMKATHINHPSAIWCRETNENYTWLYHLWFHLCEEYTYRYGKIHACARLRDYLYYCPQNIPSGSFFGPTPAMPDEVKIPGDSLASYRNYYINNKKHLASWAGKVNSRNQPEWLNA
jgi:hypothetical protein